MGQICEKPLTPDDILWVLNRTNICSLAVAEENQPYVIPMYYTCCADQNQITFTMLSQSSGLKMRCMQVNNQVCLNVMVPVRGGYASVVAFGLAAINCIGVDDCFNKREEIQILVTDITGLFIPSC